MTRAWTERPHRFRFAAVSLAALFLSVGLSPAPDAAKPADAFADPKRYTAVFQLIEIDRSDWDAWLAVPANSTAGLELRAHLQTLLKDRKATLIDTALTVCSEGEEVEIASGGEYIYPTEGDPAEVASTGTAMTHRIAAAYETRNTGLGLTVRVTGPRKRSIDGKPDWVEPQVDLEFDRVLRLRDDSHGSGANERKMPVFHSLAHRGSVSYRPGESVLISSHRPDKAADEKRENPVVLAFLRLDPIELDE